VDSGVLGGEFATFDPRCTPTKVGILFMTPSILTVALSMSLAFEHYTGVQSTSLTTENSLGFVSALNSTFFAAIGLTVIALFTSATRGDR
jgi:hypothetical protein